MSEARGSAHTDGEAATATRARPHRRASWIAAAAAGALAIGGGATWAVTAGPLAGSAQPEDVLPSGALAFVKVDLDPGVAQKAGAFRLFDKVPEVKKALGDGDPKKALFDLARRDSADLQKIDYARDIEPWLGDRAGVALLPPDKAGAEPVPVVALAVEDEAEAKEAFERAGAAAQASLDKAEAGAAGAVQRQKAGPGSVASDEKPVTVYKDGYVLVASQKDKARVDKAVAGATLAADPTFAGDLDAIGETGVASGWVDSGRLFDAVRQASPSGSADDEMTKQMATLGQGRTAFAVRFAPDHLEIAQVTRGAKLGVPNAPALKDVTNLPADTAAFASFTGGSDYLGQVWPMILEAAKADDPDAEAELRDLEQSTGLSLPADLKTLLGRQVDLVVAKQDFADDSSAPPKVGARLWTDTAEARSILEKIDRLIGSATSSGTKAPQTIFTKVSGEHLDVAPSAASRDNLSAGGSIASAPAFGTVLPGLDTATGAMYVDLDAIEGYYLPDVPADQRDLVRSLQAVGVTVGPLVNGEQRSTIRLAVD